jgi:hypothetical protein
VSRAHVGVTPPTNETSGRYLTMRPEFYVPPSEAEVKAHDANTPQPITPNRADRRAAKRKIGKGDQPPPEHVITRRRYT